MKQVILFFVLISACTQLFGQPELSWQRLNPGMSFCEIDAPEPSFVGDSKLFILRIEPNAVKFNLLCASQHDKLTRTAPEWADEFGVNVVLNAGMYGYGKSHPNKGYMQNYSHINSSKLIGGYNVMAAMNPKKKDEPAFKLYDLTQTPWQHIKPKYQSFSQGMRMIDFEGNPMAWDKKPWQSCSMLLCSTDTDGIIYYFFSRSPYTHKQMIGFLLGLPLKLRTTVYLEGGPEASLYIKTPDTTIIKFGSYVARSYENDTNSHYWRIPNVIGLRSK